jgi:hypothetical protein
MVTPLQYKEFFAGIWRGEGELVPYPLLRWVVRKETITFESRTIWLSDTVWMLKESFVFSSTGTISRTMFVQLLAPDRLHVTADDMPLGSDITLSQNGFRFSTYYIRLRHRGMPITLQCLDDNVIQPDGTIRDTIKMYFFGLRVATMNLTAHRNVHH